MSISSVWYVPYVNNIFLRIHSTAQHGFDPRHEGTSKLGGGQGLSIAKMQSYSSSNNSVALFDYDF